MKHSLINKCSLTTRLLFHKTWPPDLQRLYYDWRTWPRNSRSVNTGQQNVGDNIWVYGTNTISVLMLSCGRTDYYVCVCVCAYMREDDEWIRASSLNTATVVYDWMLLLRWKGLGDFSRDEAQSINKWLLTTPSIFHEPWPRDLQQLYSTARGCTWLRNRRSVNTAGLNAMSYSSRGGESAAKLFGNRHTCVQLWAVTLTKSEEHHRHWYALAQVWFHT